MRNLLLLAGAATALRTSTLGLGCFWEPSEKLLKLDGVVDTRCGYAGAAFPDAKPDYNSVCGGDGNVECVPVWNSARWRRGQHSSLDDFHTGACA
jgi:peptide methionine sulfoxide reductase MsrA